MLYNAARAYQAARLVNKAIEVRRILIDPRYHLQNTELGKKTLYGGSGRIEDVTDYLGNTLARWLDQRRRAVDEAEKAYLEVLAIQPLPPPRWVVAAVARVARMRGKLAAEILAAPSPRAWKAQGASPWGRSWEEIRADFRRRLERRASPSSSAPRRPTGAVAIRW